MPHFAKLLISLLIGLSLQAKEVKILHFSTVASKYQGEVYIEFDKNKDIASMAWKLIRPNGRTEKNYFSIEDLHRGTVFKKGLFKKYIKVQGKNFSAHQGGNIAVTIPRNIFTGKKIRKEISYDRNGDDWSFNNQNAIGIRSIIININKGLFGLPLGIKSWSYAEASIIYQEEL